MDPNRLITVAGCGNVSEADLLRIALEQADIETVIDGGELNNSLGYIGSAIGDVKILVRAGDFDEAASIVKETLQSFEAPLKDPWFCGECLEEVEGGFDLCWSCGQLRDDVKSPFPACADVIESIGLPEVELHKLGRVSDNPFESPRSANFRVPKQRAEESVAEMWAGRAMISAGLSVIFPVISLLLMLIAVVPLFYRRKSISVKARSRIAIAGILAALIHAAWVGALLCLP